VYLKEERQKCKEKNIKEKKRRKGVEKEMKKVRKEGRM